MKDDKGYVYIICNKAMPGLCKVGFTLKDPTLRAKELAHTGIPLPYEVVYHAFVDTPRILEGKVHKHLARCNVGKEWFKISAEDCVIAIKYNSDKIYQEKVNTFISLAEAEARAVTEKKIKEHSDYIENLQEQRRSLQYKLKKNKEDFIFEEYIKNAKIIFYTYLCLVFISFMVTNEFWGSVIGWGICGIVLFFSTNAEIKGNAEKKYLDSWEYKNFQKEISNLTSKINKTNTQNYNQNTKHLQTSKNITKPKEVNIEGRPWTPTSNSTEPKEANIEVYPWIPKSNNTEPQEGMSNVLCLLCYKRFRIPDKKDIIAKCPACRVDRIFNPTDNTFAIVFCESCNGLFRIPKNKDIISTCPHCQAEKRIKLTWNVGQG